MLERVIERVSQSDFVDQVVVASPHEIPLKLDVPVFIGDEFDVVKRYYDCCKFFNADIVVRITSDCPLIEPSLIDECIFWLVEDKLDHVAAIEPHYPDGLDVEVFTKETLKKTFEEAKEREHVCYYMRSGRFAHRCLDYGGYGHEKISVDTESDLEKVRQIWNGEIKLSYS